MPNCSESECPLQLEHKINAPGIPRISADAVGQVFLQCHNNQHRLVRSGQCWYIRTLPHWICRKPSCQARGEQKTLQFARESQDMTVTCSFCSASNQWATGNQLPVRRGTDPKWLEEMQ